MTLLTLKTRTDVGRRTATRLRRAGQVPGVIYGDQTPSRSFSLSESLVAKILKEQGTSAMLDVQLEGEDQAVKAIVHAVQSHPLTGRPEHIDLYQVRLDKVLHTEVPLHFAGTSQAVKDFGGILVKQGDHLAIECLPADLPHAITISIDSLKSFGDSIRVKDLVLPAGVKVKLAPEAILVNVAAPRSEAELEALKGEVKADVATVEVLTEKKKEEEGAEAAPADEKK